MKTASRLGILSLLLALTLSAGEPAAVPPQPPVKAGPPKRPFPTLPQIIWYDDFELGPVHFEKGKIGDNPVPQMKDNVCMELTEQDKNNKQVWTIFKPLMVAAKFPDGTAPAQIGIAMNVWVEENGEFTIKAFHKGGDYSDKITVSKEKTWTPISLKLADLRNKQSRAEAAHLIEKIEIFFAPREKKEFKKAYIDDLLITTGVPRPDSMLPLAQRARQQVLNMIKTTAKDGYNFNQTNQETLKTALKAVPPKRRNKAVLAFGSRPEDGAELVKGMAAAAGKIKLNGYTFANGEIPESGPAGGIEDTRSFLLSNIARTDPEFVLILLSAQDAKVPGRPVDSLRVTIDRALSAGAIPIVALPLVVPGMADKEKKDLDGFVNAVSNLCGNKGVSTIDTSVAVKAATNPTDGAELSAAGLDAVGALAATVVKHIEANVILAKK